MAGEDTLTAAEEQALARARQKVGSRTSSGTKRSSSGGRRTSGSSGAKRGGKRSGKGGGKGTAKGRGRSSRPTRARPKGRGRRGKREPSLDTARGMALLLAVALAAVPDPWLPELLRATGGDGFGLPDLLPATFALLAGTALDHQVTARRRATGRWWTGRLTRRIVVLVAVGTGLTWLGHRDPATLPWTSAYARLAVAGLVAWFLLRDLSRRAQAVLVGAWVVGGAVLALRGGTLLPGVDARLLGAHARPAIDPDGLVGVLASVVLMLVGAWIGAWLRSRPAGPATVVAFTLTAVYVGVAGIAWAQLEAVNALRWSGPTLLLGASLALALLAGGHLMSRLPSPDRLAWVRAAGAVALPVGAGGLLLGHLVGVGASEGPWHHVTTTMVLPVLGPSWGAVLVGLAAAALAARVGALLVERGWVLRA